MEEGNQVSECAGISELNRPLFFENGIFAKDQPDFSGIIFFQREPFTDDNLHTAVNFSERIHTYVAPKHFRVLPVIFSYSQKIDQILTSTSSL